MAGMNLQDQVGTYTKKGTLITQAVADAVTADNDYIKVLQDNGQLIAKLMYSAIQIALEKIGIAAEGDVIGYMTSEYIVDTGRLRNSITHRVLNGEQAVIVGTNVEYAGYVHNGTSRVKARPFLTDPINKNKKAYNDILKKQLGGQ